eukprot:14540913-Ditylum_brightwellii.AAC.2
MEQVISSHVEHVTIGGVTAGKCMVGFLQGGYLGSTPSTMEETHRQRYKKHQGALLPNCLLSTGQPD